MTWSLPDTYHSAGHGRGTATLKFYEGRGILVSDTTLAIELDDAETRVVRRTTTMPVRNIKADRPWAVPTVS